jgi:transcriptional regulator with XRE-family HTH domain
MNKVQERIAKLQESNWKIVAIARRLGVHRNTVIQWRNGSRYPTLEQLVLEKLDSLRGHNKKH